MKKLCRQYAKWNAGDVDGLTFQGHEYEILRVIPNYEPSGGIGFEFVNSKGQLDRACGRLFKDYRVTNMWLFKLRHWYIRKFPNSTIALKGQLATYDDFMRDKAQEIAELREQLQSKIGDAITERDYAQSMEINKDLTKRVAELVDDNDRLEALNERLVSQLAIVEQDFGNLDRKCARLTKERDRLKEGRTAKRRAA